MGSHVKEGLFGHRCRWYRGLTTAKLGLLPENAEVAVKQWRTPRHGTRVMIFAPDVITEKYELLGQNDVKGRLTILGALPEEEQKRLNRAFNDMWGRLMKGCGSAKYQQQPT